MKKIIIPLVIYILIGILATSVYFYKVVSGVFDMNLGQIFNLVGSARLRIKSNNENNFSFIVLGLDPRDDWLEISYDTDTIIMTSLDLKTSKVKMMPLYRDIWHSKLNCKINALYEKSKLQVNPWQYLSTNYENITGIPIEKFLIIETSDIEKLISIIDGVDVYLENGFEDDRYPNQKYIEKIERNPYITIKFDQGWNHIDGSNVSYFVRSRKNAQTAFEGGTDTGRAARQQLLLNAIIKKIANRSIIKNLDLVKNLYKFWRSDIETNISNDEILALIFKIKKNIFNISLESYDIPIGLNLHEGVIYHPEDKNIKAWIFLPSSGEGDYSSLKSHIKNKLFTSN